VTFSSPIILTFSSPRILKKYAEITSEVPWWDRILMWGLVCVCVCVRVCECVCVCFGTCHYIDS
jgi:hypothetical protein